ncbi:MAG TPA: hypothetical protein VFS34_00545 [Thermoanaerobaculia bacterium]|nr:hypothetical protein [Thermoanaerobaculia bacterium]
MAISSKFRALAGRAPRSRFMLDAIADLRLGTDLAGAVPAPGKRA